MSSAEETAIGTTLCESSTSASTPPPRGHLPPITESREQPPSSLEVYASENGLTSVFFDDEEMSPLRRFVWAVYGFFADFCCCRK
ncbi:hypothetical protein D9756_010298 [Leucocoprinus leucothites]|uniref:Uncharacterized protein n=1 Tax=Leucocoprinus leucothites TaxID=201217 RepID=A0A8H5CTN7_9AGAR|nr:hypothetical protein D9756_010298 [Leucoagaricus leucothites]